MKNAQEVSIGFLQPSEQLPVAVAPVAHIPQAPKKKVSLSLLQKAGYSLLSIALLVALVQASRCLVVYTLKLDQLFERNTSVETAYQQTQSKNTVLKDKIFLYQSPLGIEELARERLDMVKRDEILVRLAE